MKKKRKINITTIILLLILLVGLSLLLYPTVSDWWNARHQSQMIKEYDTLTKQLSQEDVDREFERANTYNRQLAELWNPLTQYTQIPEYDNILNLDGQGVMGYVSIPKINVELPVYHGTAGTVLNEAIGHLEGTSLPVGGLGTHSVLSGHRGLPSAKLFSNLDQLTEGDTFTLKILNETLTYEVDQIRIVLPDETSDLAIDPDQDYCTLLTCTPYGVNTHRLLVRGTRISGDKKVLAIEAEAYALDSLLLVPWVTFLIIVILVAGSGVFRRIRRGRRKQRT